MPKPGNLEPWDSPPTLHGYKGGNLLGVAEKLEYLEDLGVSALYFNPVFQSASNHRYYTHDYFRVDPMLGGNAALRELLDACHKRDMRLVLDRVFNHASRGFFQFNDILENGQASPYLDWFHVRRFPLNPYPQAITDAQFNLLGSHDTPRCLTSLADDESAVRLAFFLLFTLPGAPCLYCGDELGLEGVGLAGRTAALYRLEA